MSAPRSFVACSVLFLAGCASTVPPQQQQARLISLEQHGNTRRPQADDSSLDALIASYTARQRDIAALPRSNLASDRYASHGSSDADSALVSSALEHLGVRYKWGGTNPDTGFDCSGLVVYAARESLGLQLPRSASEMAHEGKAVSRAELQPGDLVFFNTLGRRFSHVGIYVGDNQFVHAPNSKGVVRIESMDIRYWSKRFNGARRLSASAS
ncbi:C40 family peptidase [Kerstersia similis]|uniref:C40 family peptidase n=1 Tax=Kerstersia similis TaxID=206505 RepID=UPI0039F0D925